MIKKVITTVLFAATLSACKSTPPAADVSLTDTPSIRYKLPLDHPVDIRFNTYDKCISYSDSGCSKYDSIKFVRKSGDVVVERRVHNGIAGSGAVFTINEKTERTAEVNLVTYQPVKMSSYRQGLIFTFPVPNMDIADYLSNTQFTTRFELNSDYPSQSVKANFDRLMNKARRDFRIYGNTNSKLDLEDYYMLDVNGAQVVMLVESFPYRNGSKVVVNAVIQTRKASSGLIDVAAIIKSVKQKVAEVINS